MLVNMCKGTRSLVKAYSGRDGGFHKETGDEHNTIFHRDGLNNLTTSNIGVGLVHQQSWDKAGSLGDVGSIVGTVENVVLENRLDDVGLVQDGGSDGVVHECFESLIAGSQKGDVGCLGQLAN